MTDVRTIRQQLGLTQVELAQALGVRQATVSRMETGQRVDGRTKLALEALVARHHSPIATAAGGSASPDSETKIIGEAA